MKTLAIIIGGVTLGFLWAPLASAETNIAVYRDAYFDDFTNEQAVPPDGVPDRISDTNALLASRGEFFDEWNSFNVDSHAVMTFDVSSYVGTTLEWAHLTGYGTRVDNQGSLDPITGQFYLYRGNGLVEFDDFNTPATYIGEWSFYPNPGGFDLDRFELDVKPALQTLLNNPLTSFAEFRVESEAATVFINAGEVGPDSGFSVDPRWPGPILTVSIVPEPIGGLLMLVGGLFMGSISRRRRQKISIIK